MTARATARLLVVGSIVVDLAFHVPRRPLPGEVAFADRFGRYRGGKGFNQAVAAARLGAEVVMVGAVGDDDFGRDMTRALADEGVDVSRVAVVAGEPTAIAVPIITPDGDVAFVHHRGANATLTAAVAEDLPEVDAVLLQGEVSPAASTAVARAMRDRGTPVVLNPAPVSDVPAELADLATLLIPNEAEATALLTAHGDAVEGDVLDGVQAARRLATPDRHAVVTLGARGAAWSDAEDAGIVAPPWIEPVDATAAGDSFCAALAIELVGGASYPDALRVATAAGAHAATVHGAQPSLPTRADVDRLLG